MLGIGVYLLADRLHRLPTHANFVGKNLSLFPFDHAFHQQHDLFRPQTSPFKYCATVHVLRLLTTSTPISGHLAALANPELSRPDQCCATMWTLAALWVEVFQQPFITALTRQPLDDWKLNWHGSFSCVFPSLPHLALVFIIRSPAWRPPVETGGGNALYFVCTCCKLL